MERKFPALLLFFRMINILLNFKKKEIFNSFFAEQCFPISNKSVLRSELPLRTDSTLFSCHFTKNYILQIINNLDPNKIHGHNNINIRMLNICDDSIFRPLNIIFKLCFCKDKFPLEWEKANIVPINKNGDK